MKTGEPDMCSLANVLMYEQHSLQRDFRSPISSVVLNQVVRISSLVEAVRMPRALLSWSTSSLDNKAPGEMDAFPLSSQYLQFRHL
jgi:hypothetical protein